MGNMMKNLKIFRYLKDDFEEKHMERLPSQRWHHDESLGELGEL